MTLARTYSIALVGAEGHLVEVEADIANGLPMTILTGLPDTALREARERIHAAILNSRQSWPETKITIELRPTNLPKRGRGFDLVIAVAIPSLQRQVLYRMTRWQTWCSSPNSASTAAYGQYPACCPPSLPARQAA